MSREHRQFADNGKSAIRGWRRIAAFFLLFAFSIGSSGLILRRDICLKSGNTQWLLGFAFTEACQMAEAQLPAPKPEKSCCKKAEACPIAPAEITDESTCCTYEQVQLRVASFLPASSDATPNIPLIQILIFALLISSSLYILKNNRNNSLLRCKIPVPKGKNLFRLFCVWRL